MAWVNFREIQDRFTHIDAKFVSANARFEESVSEVTVTVRFYPWWEHPLYVAARNAGEPWGFRDTSLGARDVTVKAINPVGVNLAPASEIIDWAFLSEHPVLWDFSEHLVIYVNGPFDARDLTDRLVARKMPFVQRQDLFRYLDPTWPLVSSRGVSLPTQLQGPVIEELAAMDIPTFVPRSAAVPSGLIVFLIDGSEYVVAEDFEIDVPEFKHDPTWCHPVSGGAG